MTSPKLIKKLKSTTFKFYSDPGHGWLAVKRSILDELGILHRVSAFSYQRGQTVYLEEDRDVSLFVDACIKLGITLKEKEGSYNNDRSPIRSYSQFDSGPMVGIDEGVHSEDCDKLFGGKCSCPVENQIVIF